MHHAEWGVVIVLLPFELLTSVHGALWLPLLLQAKDLKAEVRDRHSYPRVCVVWSDASVTEIGCCHFFVRVPPRACRI